MMGLGQLTLESSTKSKSLPTQKIISLNYVSFDTENHQRKLSHF